MSYKGPCSSKQAPKNFESGLRAFWRYAIQGVGFILGGSEARMRDKKGISGVLVVITTRFRAISILSQFSSLQVQCRV